jgi:uncharacterized membrane protein
MNTNILLIAIGIGIVAGLRTMTAPAVVSWAAHLGWLHLQGSPLAFMGSTVAVAIFSLGAISEYVVDKLPNTPSRTAPTGFVSRIVSGSFCGACVHASSGQSLIFGSIVGAMGAVIGTLGGHAARTRLVKALKVKDIFVAIPEDLIAISLGLLLLCVR